EKSDPLRALAHRSLPSILRIISTFNLPTLHSLLLRNRPCVKRKGRTKAASAPPESMEVTGGPSGTGWPFGPSACHTYCSLPNVTIVTGPEKNPWRPPLESSNATRTKVAPRDAAGLEGIVLEGDEGQVGNPSVRLQVVDEAAHPGGPALLVGPYLDVFADALEDGPAKFCLRNQAMNRSGELQVKRGVVFRLAILTVRLLAHLH